MSTRLLLALAISLPLAACGDKDGDDGSDGSDGSDGADTETCYLNATSTGAIDETFDYTSNQGCASSSYDDSASFSWGINADTAVLLWINSGVDWTQSNQSGLSGTVTLIDSATYAEWSSASDACDVELTAIYEDPDWEGDMVLEGSVTCADPLVNDADSSEATLSVAYFSGSAPR